jgi:large subunit ribosomal protein L10
MPTAQKERTIEQAKDWYSRSVGVVFTDYRGLKVKDMQELRSRLKAKGGEIHVLKNTLFRVAAGEDTAKIPEDLHNGPTAIAFLYENESEGAKALLDYAKINKNLTVKGGFFGGRAFDAKQVEALSELPPRDQLIAQLIGVVAAPLSNLASVIEALYADPIRVIGAVADKVAKDSPAPAEEAAATSTESSAPAAPAIEEPTQAAPEDAGGPPEQASVEEAPAADAQPEAATPAPDQPVETAADTNSTEAEASPDEPQKETE